MPTKRQQLEANNHPHEQPWGMAIGLLTGCIVTVTGVVSNFEPDIILIRAVTAGITMGLTISVFIHGWKLISPTTDEED